MSRPQTPLCTGLCPPRNTSRSPPLKPSSNAPPCPSSSRCRSIFFFSSRRRHTRLVSDWSSDVCSSDLGPHDGGFCPDACPSNDAGLQRIDLACSLQRRTQRRRRSADEREDCAPGSRG